MVDDARFQRIETAIKEAGTMLRKGFFQLGENDVREKSPGDFVTVYDVKSERTLIEMIEDTFPTHGYIAEEKGTKKEDAEYVWVIDPLDGTTNFTVKNPFFNISVALTQLQKGERVPVYGAVYCPITKEFFRARQNEGATCNGDPIQVSERSDLAGSFVSFCMGSGNDAKKQGANLFRSVRPRVGNLRQIGAGALELSYVACGRIDAFYMNDMNPWDVMAGALFVQEAGGTVMDFNNERFTIDSQDILATNGAIHEELLEMLQ